MKELGGVYRLNNLLSKKTQNYLFIIKHLYLEDIKINFFIKSTDTSRLTVISTIDSLNQIIHPSEIKIINDDFSLVIPAYDSYDHCVSKILTDSIELTILEKIFFEEKHSYLSLSEELFISESTFRRTIAHLNKRLDYFNMTIKTRPLRIVGEERLIRLFFFRLFIEKYGAYNPPFKKSDIEYIKQFYHLKIPFLKREKNMQDEYNFILFSLTSFQRERLEHRNSASKRHNILKLVVSIIDKFPVFGFSRSIKSQLSDSIDSLANVFYLYLSEDFLGESETSQIITNQHTKVEAFVNKIIVEFSLELPANNKKNLIRDVYDANFGFLALKNDWVKLTINNNEYSNFYTFNKNLLDKERFQQLFIDTFSESFLPYLPITYFLIYTRAYNENDDEFVPIKVGFFIDYDKKYSDYFFNILNKNIPARFKLINLSDENVMQYPNKLEDVKYLITNCFDNFEFKIDDIYRINHFCTEDELFPIIGWLSEKKKI